MTSALGTAPQYARTRLLPIYAGLLSARARAGVFGDLYVEVDRREYLQLMYETGQYRGIAAIGESLVWAPWPTDPDQALPSAVEVRLPGGRIMFRCPADRRAGGAKK